ncbi:EAL and HDOD domain-containing protein [Cellulomonas cellasea]|uniref:EAL and modified HD-GYP domain-containing signal transduction protein n=1 Tax=Cellulomonas cellasea TaxID=43670 RepID=A0A7W4UHE7_9CELL|nr:HDOD domain-containing protein [Cellulomonas cellasea]MBB2924224.1 EAL and modified HD-GYP domain-containing signal transduction protein [Cellulomonas cellasea]
MSVIDDPGTPTRVSEISVLRQPVVYVDRSVYGYAVRVAALDPAGEAVPEHEIAGFADAEYARLDLPRLAGDHVVFLRATPRVLLGDVALLRPSSGVVLEITPELTHLPDVAGLVAVARQRGFGIALADYTGTLAQDDLLDQADFVKIDIGRGYDRLAMLVARAQGSGVLVIAERADTRERIKAGLDLGVEMLQGPMFERDPEVVGRSLTAGELQCLELLQLLTQNHIDQAAVVRTVGSDPELVMRVLHLVNASTFALRRKVDSVHQAVVLVGPHQLSAVAMASLIDAQPTAIGPLWSILTRALSCRAVTGADAAYTVGLLSAVAAHQRIAVDELVERTGVSADVADALRSFSGPYGPALAAVLALEENDIEGVRATGLEPYDVAQACLAVVPEALATATALAVAAPA